MCVARARRPPCVTTPVRARARLQEVKTWETQKEESGKMVQALKIFLTVATSLYLPISRTVFQARVDACDLIFF